MKYLPTLSVLLFFLSVANAQNPSELPLFSINQLEYEGAFRISAAGNGNSSLNYSQGPIEYNSDNHSLFIVGHTYQQAIAEYSIPDLVNSSILSDLNMADDTIQSFTSILNSTNDNNPQNINRIGGLEYITKDGENPMLVVNGYEYYDAPADNTATTAIIQNGLDIQNSNVDGFYRFEGGAGHTSGWISPIPQEWRAVMEGDHITGHSSGIPILSRCTVGPSAFVFDSEDLIGQNLSTISTSKLLDFPYSEGWLHNDLYNSDGDNDIWTHLSSAKYGFIVPGTRTYLTIGNSGGHNSGVCYKCTQDNGNLCGGYCAPDHTDYYQYFWLWDMEDLQRVKNGDTLSYQIKPYSYGVFETPFQNGFNPIGGGTFDPVSGLLYLSIQKADRAQGTYANPPVIVAYSINSEVVLATEWLDFQVKLIEEDVKVTWSVTQDDLTGVFEIQRSRDQRTWITIGVKNYSENSKNEQDYEFMDRDPLMGVNYYRIKKVNYDAIVDYSHVKSINIRQSNRVKLFPNPVLDMLTIEVDKSISLQFSEIELYSFTGQKVRAILPEVVDLNFIQLDLSYLDPGVYFLHLKNPLMNQIEKIIRL